MGRLLEIQDLGTSFYTQDGVVKAVNGVSYTLDEGETLGLVGESGCGKSECRSCCDWLGSTPTLCPE